MNTTKNHLLKSFALIVSVITAIILLHNLYLFEINYGLPAIHYSNEVTKPAVSENDPSKVITSIIVVLNILSVAGTLFNYFSEDPENRRFELNFMKYDNIGIVVIIFFTYIIDSLIVIGLLSYLVYLIL